MRTRSLLILMLWGVGISCAQAEDAMGRYLQMDCPQLAQTRQQLEQRADQLAQQGDTAAQQDTAQQLVAVKLLMRRKACAAD